MDTLQHNIKQLLLDYENFTQDQIELTNNALESILLTDDQKSIIEKCQGIKAKWIERNVIDFSILNTSYMTYRYVNDKYLKIDQFINGTYYPECSFKNQSPITEEEVLENIKRLLD